MRAIRQVVPVQRLNEVVFEPSDRLRDLLGRRPGSDEALELRPVWTCQQADGGCRGETRAWWSETTEKVVWFKTQRHGRGYRWKTRRPLIEDSRRTILRDAALASRSSHRCQCPLTKSLTSFRPPNYQRHMGCALTNVSTTAKREVGKWLRLK